MSSRDGLDDLEERFKGRGFTFRCYPNASCDPLRYQCGVIEPTRVIIPEGIGRGITRSNSARKSFGWSHGRARRTSWRTRSHSFRRRLVASFSTGEELRQRVSIARKKLLGT